MTVIAAVCGNAAAIVFLRRGTQTTQQRPKKEQEYIVMNAGKDSANPLTDLGADIGNAVAAPGGRISSLPYKGRRNKKPLEDMLFFGADARFPALEGLFSAPAWRAFCWINLIVDLHTIIGFGHLGL